MEKTKTIKVNITQEHLDASACNNARLNAMALAIREQHPELGYPFTEYDCIYIYSTPQDSLPYWFGHLPREPVDMVDWSDENAEDCVDACIDACDHNGPGPVEFEVTVGYRLTWAD